MQKSLTLIASLTIAATLAGCGSSSIFDRDRPDEFAVSRQAPLVIPPDFSLEPPQPGAVRPQSTTASEQALDALFGGKAERSATENDAISRAGDDMPGIRSLVGDPGTNVVDKGTLTREIVSAPESQSEFAKAAIPQ